MAFGHHFHKNRWRIQAVSEVLGGKTMMFSHSFVRKPLISLAATAAVAATSLVVAHEPASAQSLRETVPVQYIVDRPDHSGETSFLSENQSAMNKMMANMAVKPTGDVDRDFVAMMVPHHQGAVDMARAELKYGHNKQLRRMAQTIVTNQQKQITAMRRAVGEPPLPSVAPPAPETSPHPMPPAAMNMSHDSMSDGSMK
jgi:hypothetical protein